MRSGFGWACAFESFAWVFDAFLEDPEKMPLTALTPPRMSSMAGPMNGRPMLSRVPRALPALFSWLNLEVMMPATVINI